MTVATIAAAAVVGAIVFDARWPARRAERGSRPSAGVWRLAAGDPYTIEWQHLRAEWSCSWTHESGGGGTGIPWNQ